MHATVVEQARKLLAESAETRRHTREMIEASQEARRQRGLNLGERESAVFKKRLAQIGCSVPSMMRPAEALRRLCCDNQMIARPTGECIGQGLGRASMNGGR